MHFGLYVNPETSGPEHDGRHIQEVIRQCELASEVGYKAIWSTEHHFMPYNTYSDCIILAAYLAARLPDMYLGFSLAILPLHHPVRFAEQCALVDQLTQGKLIVGIGAGATGAIEFYGYGLGDEHENRHALFDEAWDLLDKLWRHKEGVFEYKTPRFEGKIEGRIVPRPYQQPYPLVARGTVHTEFAERWGAMGQPILYAPWGPDHVGPMREAHEKGLAQCTLGEERKQAAREWSSMLKVVHVAETDAEAERDFRVHAEKHLEMYQLANRGKYMLLDEFGGDVYLDKWLNTQAIVGSPDTVAEHLAPYTELGIEHIMTWMNIGTTPHELVSRSIRLFGEKVIPQLASLSPAGIK